jgi:diguanylate cyclase
MEPYTSLDAALGALVNCINLFVPLRLWMVTRVHGSDWNVLYAEDTQREIARGTVFSWPDSFCCHMVKGDGPRFAPDAQAIATYAAASINKTMPIGAYIGQPLVTADGKLLGTLCGLDPEPKPAFTADQERFVEMIARTMCTLIASKLILEHARLVEAQWHYLAQRDALTGLSNRRGWDLALAEEEDALDQLGENAMVLVADLDGLKLVNDTNGHAAGDRYLVAAAHALRAQLREIDIAARVGGDEFAILVRDTTKEQAQVMYDRIVAAFDAAGVQASFGYGMRLSAGSLAAALAVADTGMYEDKARRKRALRVA